MSLSVLLEEPELHGVGKDLGGTVGLSCRKSSWSPGEGPHLSMHLARSLLRPPRLAATQPHGCDLALGVLLNILRGWPGTVQLILRSFSGKA